MQKNQWIPDYAERYYTVNKKLISELKSVDHIHLAVNRFMWLDIDDDLAALEDGLVFRTEDEAIKYATAVYNGETGAV